ncbi:MAG: AzlD domain-containing protein [Pseudomonadota bacterium]|nr:AzlD domain-containing protein [Pseudomonadota bacterium]
MTDGTYITLFITVSSLATFATRVVPFVFLHRHTGHPLIRHLGRYLPAAVMALLATVFLKQSANWNYSLPGLDALVAGLIVTGIHLWRRNALLSIAAGTGAYMLFQQTNPGL